jgi:hypothetical protein
MHHYVIPRDEMTKNPVIPGYFIIRFRQTVFYCDIFYGIFKGLEV